MMKHISKYIAAASLAASAVFVSCDDHFTYPPAIVPGSVEVEATIPMADFKTQYWGAVTAPTIVGYQENGDTLIFTGRVCSSDESGNIFKNIVIQSVDEETGEQVAMTFSINSYDLYQIFPFGQEVAVYASDMQIGGYHNLLQFGAISGNEMTFMDLATAQEHIVRNRVALPEPAKVDTTVATVAEIVAAKKDQAQLMRWQSRLIRVDGVSFEDAGKPCAATQNENRYIRDAEGNRLIVRMSSYADFKSELLPSGTGSVVGILSYYNSDWQIMLNDFDGLIDFDGQGGDEPTPGPGGDVEPAGEGTAESPYNVAKTLQLINSGNITEAEVYVAGKISKIKEIDTGSYGNASYYIIDEGGSEEFYIFRGYGLDKKKFTAETELEVGAEVVVCGKLINYMGNTPEMAQGNYLYKYNGEGGNGGDQPGGEEPNPPTPGTGSDPATILATAITVPGSSTIEGYAITIDQASGATTPSLHAGTSAIRLYAGNTITVSGASLTSIKFVLASDAHFRYTTMSCSTGSITPAQVAGDTEFTWVGNATSVTFTVGEQATLGDDGDSKKGQIRFTQLDINGGNGGGGNTPTPDPDPNPNPNPDPEPDPNPGTGTESTVINATALNVAGSVTIDGYNLTIAQGSGATAPAQHAGTSAVRLYAGNTLTISGGSLKSIKFILSSDAHFRYTTMACSTGAISPAQAAGDTEFTWVGDATSVTFTVGEQATLGDDGEAKKGQIRFTSLNIN